MHKHRSAEKNDGKGRFFPAPPPIPLSPVMEMVSEKELIVESVVSLLYYDETAVRIRTRRALITVSGNLLTVKCLANGNLAVCGEMTAICFEKP